MAEETPRQPFLSSLLLLGSSSQFALGTWMQYHHGNSRWMHGESHSFVHALAETWTDVLMNSEAAVTR